MSQSFLLIAVLIPCWNSIKNCLCTYVCISGTIYNLIVATVPYVLKLWPVLNNSKTGEIMGGNCSVLKFAQLSSVSLPWAVVAAVYVGRAP